MRAIITVIAVNIATILLVSLVSYRYWPEYPDGTTTYFDEPSATLNTVPAPPARVNTARPGKAADPATFGGYPCGDDCSQNAAGYLWAVQHGIADPANCDGGTAPFIEGCRVYADERRARL
jgi:hypothetical protein